MIESILWNGQLAGTRHRTITEDQEILLHQFERNHYDVMEFRQQLIHEIDVDAPDSPYKQRLYSALNSLTDAQNALWDALGAYSEALVEYIADPFI